jgi:hypothetical protein
MSAASGALSEEQADAGPGLMRALCQLGGAIGVAAVRVALIASGALVAAGAILAAFFLPRHTPPVAGQPAVAPTCRQRPAR